ncbi:hypothetical protein B9Z19DRAFT_1131470 [Tuber borchii]|uniref:Uncharacterized protein n=1 Tax=Tuber borchii TaxID=42251 RepID=A0A2T6ZIQ3_TUBBO|nr:hypothetical protein B9Z19DRAFT_1131470 [Tuber borchii]
MNAGYQVELADLLQWLRSAGIIIDGLAIGAGILSIEVINECIETALKHISFKRSFIDAIQQEINNCKGLPNFPGGSAEETYRCPAGGVIMVQSEMGEPIYKGAELDRAMFSLDRAKHLVDLNQRNSSHPGDEYLLLPSPALPIRLWFVKSRPPTPPGVTAAEEKLGIKKSLGVVFRNRGFFVGFGHVIMLPYGHTADDEAGVTDAILIIAGLLTELELLSQINDTTNGFLLAIRTLVLVIALISALLGATSFSLLSLVLEWAVGQTHPAPPELTNVTLWLSGQRLGAAFLITIDALKDKSVNEKIHGTNRRIEIDKVAA